MPAAFARSAISRPTAFAASTLPVPLRSLFTASCTVEAAASTLPPVRIEHLRVDVARRAMHGQPGHAQLTDVLPGLEGAALTTVFGSERLMITSRYFFLPSLRLIFSSEYFTPLPL